MTRILITGATGQIGSDLVTSLHDRAAANRIVRLDLDPPASSERSPVGPFEEADVRDREALERIVVRHEIDVVYHLASLLSASGEQQPDRTWEVNVEGLKHVLDLARERDLQVFWPSSIAVFGPSTPKTQTPQHTVLDPTTIYGVTKRSGELLCRYYHHRYGVDVRSLRLPGLVSYKTAPGGGTTDYAVEMYRRAAAGAPYRCFLEPDTQLPMMYMPDAIRAILRLMRADRTALSVRQSYNLGAFSLTPRDLEASIRRRVPDFSCSYAPDQRQQIADTWPCSVNDDRARADWDWAPEYDVEAMTEDMLSHLGDTGGKSQRREEEHTGASTRGDAV
jgi:nucleoside-diphosphate-sugar epimerase